MRILFMRRSRLSDRVRRRRVRASKNVTKISAIKSLVPNRSSAWAPGRPASWGCDAMTSQDKPATTVAVKVNNKTIDPKMYKVILHNDDHNNMVHVVRSLMQVFRIDEHEATRIMIEAHEEGLALCTTEPLERAELHKEQLQALSLTSTIEPE